jgi:hypothetical protein
MDVLVAILGPTLGFGLFALLAVRFGAESRPGFDERPVLDDRPNLVPLPRTRSDSDTRIGPPPAVPRPVAAPVRPAAAPAAAPRGPRPVPRGRPAPGAA